NQPGGGEGSTVVDSLTTTQEGKRWKRGPTSAGVRLSSGLRLDDSAPHAESSTPLCRDDVGQYRTIPDNTRQSKRKPQAKRQRLALGGNVIKAKGDVEGVNANANAQARGRDLSNALSEAPGSSCVDRKGRAGYKGRQPGVGYTGRGLFTRPRTFRASSWEQGARGRRRWPGVFVSAVIQHPQVAAWGKTKRTILGVDPQDRFGSRALDVLDSAKLLCHTLPIFPPNRRHLLLAELIANALVVAEIGLRADDEAGNAGAVMMHLWKPLLAHVLEGGGGGDGEADQEDVGLGVGERTEAIVILLPGSIEEAESVWLVADPGGRG
ncbi:hypothetical protein V498_08329, partial [Pseudogymnoascus sp. VKM F-4517 (FW-2822)]